MKNCIWKTTEEELPVPFVSVLGSIDDETEYPDIRECFYVPEEDRPDDEPFCFYFPALRCFMPVKLWSEMPEA